MAWKRGTQNNKPGEIRMGHIKAFQAPSSRTSSVSGKLKILNMEDTDLPAEVAMALVCSPDQGLPDVFKSYVRTGEGNGMLFLHAHEHPTCEHM